MTFIIVFIVIILCVLALGCAIMFIDWLSEDHPVLAGLVGLSLVAGIPAGLIAYMEHERKEARQQYNRVYETQIFECYGTEYKLPANTDFTCGGEKIQGRPLHAD